MVVFLVFVILWLNIFIESLSDVNRCNMFLYLSEVVWCCLILVLKVIIWVLVCLSFCIIFGKSCVFFCFFFFRVFVIFLRIFDGWMSDWKLCWLVCVFCCLILVICWVVYLIVLCMNCFSLIKILFFKRFLWLFVFLKFGLLIEFNLIWLKRFWLFVGNRKCWCVVLIFNFS